MIGLRQGMAGCKNRRKCCGLREWILRAGIFCRSPVSMVRPCGAGKDTTPAAFLLACASGAVDAANADGGTL